MATATASSSRDARSHGAKTPGNSACLDYNSDEDLELALRIQLEEIVAILGQRKGKRREDDIDAADDLLALQTLREDIERQNGLLVDRRFAQALDGAVDPMDVDALAIAAAVDEEAEAVKDRHLALMISSRSRRSSVASVNFPSSSSSPLPSSLFQTVPGPSGTQTPRSRLPSRSVSRRASSSFLSHARQTNCVVCTELRRCVEVPCGHFYCSGCLGRLFVVSSSDTELFPPQCCQTQIPLAVARPYLSDTDVQSFLSRESEESTLSAAKGVYCFRPNCSTLIPAENIEGDSGLCPKCPDEAWTCLICKKEQHAGDCPEDEELSLTLQTAAANGWRRCPSCKRMVERTFGCQHMTCRCKAEWCYRCGKPWKASGCNCGDWVEN